MRGGRWAPYLLLLSAIVGLDQATKTLVDRMLPLHESRTVVEGFLSLTHIHNRGAAFGILSEADFPYQSVVFSVVSFIALIAIAAHAVKLGPESRLPRTALALILGGAIGNLLDRARFGFVIDFIDAYWGPRHWPAFNVADSAISIGVCLLILDLLRPAHGRQEQTTPAPVEADAPLGRTE